MVRMYRSRSMSAAENRRYPERDRAGSISPSASRKRILEVLISGNSGRSWASTSPMPNWPRADCSLMMCPPGTSCVVLGAPAAAVGGRGPRVRTEILAGQEQQPELANLHLVPAGQLGFLDSLPVHVGAVKAAHVADREPGAVPVELGVPPGDGHVVEEDVAVRMTAGRGQVAIEPEPAARVGTSHDQEQGTARRQGAERRRVGELLVGEIVVGPAQRYRRGRLARTVRRSGRGVAAGPAGSGWPGRHPGPGRHRRGQLGPAVRAEPGPVGIRPTAPGAVDAWHGSARPPLVVLIVFERPSPRYARGGGAVHAPREQPAPSAPAIFVATLPPHCRLTSAVHPPPCTLPYQARRPGLPAGGDRRANRNGRDSLTYANSARLAPFASSHERHSLPGYRANIRGPNRSIRDTWR